MESAWPVLEPPVLPVEPPVPDPVDPPLDPVSPSVVPSPLADDTVVELPEDQLSPELSGGPIGSTDPHPASTTNKDTHRIARIVAVSLGR